MSISVADGISLPEPETVTLTAPSITYTPSPPAILPVLVVVPPQGLFISGQLFTAPGVWLRDFSTGASGTAGVTLNNVVGIANDFSFGDGEATPTQTIDLPVLRLVVNEFAPTNMASLTTLSMPALTATNTFQPHDMASLTTLSAPALEATATFAPYNMDSLTTLSAPALTTVSSVFTPNNMASLTTLSMPALTTTGSFTPYSMASLTTLSMPALTTTGSFNPNTMASLTTLNAPVLTTTGNFNPTGMNNLTTLDISALTTVNGDFSPGLAP